MYMMIRPGMSSTMNLIRLELFELSALQQEKLPYLTLFVKHSSICRYRSISTKLGDNIYDQQISKSSIRDVIGLEHLELLALELEKKKKKMPNFTVYTLNIYKYQPISTKFGSKCMLL